MADVSRTRTPITKSRRWRLMRRDGFRCRYCGVAADEAGVVLELDHAVAWSRGGSDSDDNLVTACERCNQGKSDSDLRPSEVDQLLNTIGRELAAAGLPLGAVNRITKAAQDLGLPPNEVAIGWHEVYFDARPDSDEVDVWSFTDDLVDMVRRKR